MKTVSTAFSGDDDRSSGTASIFRRVGNCYDSKLLDGVNGRMHSLRAQLLNVFRDRVVVYTVQQEVVLQRSDSMHICSTGATGGRRSALFGVTASRHTRNAD